MFPSKNKTSQTVQNLGSGNEEGRRINAVTIEKKRTGRRPPKKTKCLISFFFSFLRRESIEAKKNTKVYGRDYKVLQSANTNDNSMLNFTPTSVSYLLETMLEKIGLSFKFIKRCEI